MMNEFDSRARDWDNNPVHWERSEAIAKSLLEMVPVSRNMTALEYGAGTGLLSFLLAENFSEITLMDNSEEMVKVMHEKVTASKLKNLKPLLFDLEQSDYYAGTFDCIYSQMVLHHITDTEAFLNRCRQMLKPCGYLVVADLFTEDGSFHSSNVKVHTGFDPHKISDILQSLQFKSIDYKTCFVMKRENNREYPVFILVAQA